MKILAIETSCDETAAAVVEDGTKILSNVIASSTAMHQKYGGVVPEVAAREQIKCIIPTISEATVQAFPSSIGNLQLAISNSIDAIAVTVGPGLIGSLLVGVETAKTIACVTGKPIIPVNHVLAHMYANFINSSKPSAISIQQGNSQLQAESGQQIAYPAISLVVSGGHTELYLMTSSRDLKWLGGTLDDAAGEAFDKTARLLGFENLGGPAIAAAAAKFAIGNLQLAMKLPRPLIHDDSLSFSFSGLKTAVLREWKKQAPSPQLTADSSELIAIFAHEVQEAITDVLVAKTIKAAQLFNAKSILLSGGVAANLRLREKFQFAISNLPADEADCQLAISLYVPPVPLCTDNAVYIASYAYFRGQQTDWRQVTATPDLSVETNEQH